jgi:hypothetical protein
MTKEEAINEIKSWDFLEGKEIEAIQTLIPELRESEDERIRKDIINLIYWLKANPSLCSQYYNNRYDSILAWLEKQSEDYSGFSDEQKHYMEKYISLDKVTLVKLLAERDMNVAESLRSFEGLEKQKEQKPAEYGDDVVEEAEEYTSKIDCGEYGVAVTEAYIAGVLSERNRKPAEWSEEDEKMWETIKNYLIHGSFTPFDKIEWLENRLKSLHPQQCEDKKVLKQTIYKAAMHELAIRLMNYLDENRPAGKMGLSNAECEDIDKAFAEKDWGKIIRYAEKYQPETEWKEEDKDKVKHALFNTFAADTATYLIHKIFSNTTSPQPHWKPTEEQIQALFWMIYQPEEVNKCVIHDAKSLYKQLKKL